MYRISKNSDGGLIAVISRFILVFIILFGLFIILGFHWPLGPDYYYTFRPVVEEFLRGETRLYDSNGHGYFNAPWGILLILPTLLFPINFGQALISLITITGLFFAIYALNDLGRVTQGKAALIAIALVASSLHTFDLLIRGNLEGFLLYGLGLSWIGVKKRKPLLLGFGLLLLSIKPPNLILTVFVLFWVIRGWENREKIISITPVLVAFLVSLVIIGFDWPLRYVQYLIDVPPFILHQTSLWKSFEFFGLRKELAYVLAIPVLVVFFLTLARSDGKLFGELLLGLAVATNLAISPYVLGNHFVLLAPFVVLLVAYIPWMLVLWLLTLTPLLRLIWGYEIIGIDNLYPITVMVLLLIILWRQKTDWLSSRKEKPLSLQSA